MDRMPVYLTSYLLWQESSFIWIQIHASRGPYCGCSVRKIRVFPEDTGGKIPVAQTVLGSVAVMEQNLDDEDPSCSCVEQSEMSLGSLASSPAETSLTQRATSALSLLADPSNPG